eukprot:942594-Rhodomonas_salina.4
MRFLVLDFGVEGFGWYLGELCEVEVPAGRDDADGLGLDLGAADPTLRHIAVSNIHYAIPSYTMPVRDTGYRRHTPQTQIQENTLLADGGGYQARARSAASQRRPGSSIPELSTAHRHRIARLPSRSTTHRTASLPLRQVPPMPQHAHPITAPHMTPASQNRA